MHGLVKHYRARGAGGLRRRVNRAASRAGMAAAALLVPAVLAPAVLAPAPAAAHAPVAHAAGLGGAQPLTPWRKPKLRLPGARRLPYMQLAEEGVAQAANWRRGSWYCETLGCPGRYPMLTIWGGVRMFEAVDQLQLAAPSAKHRRLVERFARASESYWNPARHAYSPYPRDRQPGVKTWFDDNGWLGLAFLGAYEATHRHRWLADAQRAFHFISSKGWDAAKGGGMWWNTSHPYHSGPALAAGSLLGILLYGADHQRWQLRDVKMYVDWGNANDSHDERHLYLEKPGKPNTVIDYVQAPLIYAQYLLCKDGEGRGYCVHAKRLAATLAESHVNNRGYRYSYGPQYDSIFMQWMMAYGRAVGERYWHRLAMVNAAAAARNAADPQGLWLSGWWGAAITEPQTRPGMFRTMAATTSLFASLALASHR